MKNISYIAICLLSLISLSSCTSMKNLLFTKQASRLSPLPEFLADTNTPSATKTQRLQLLNTQVAHYRELVTMINDYLSDMDGRQRGFSLFAIGGRGFIGATSVASMALNAASPAANAVWVQGATATNAAYANLEKEMNTQRLSGMAVRESMELTANDLVTALGALKFFDAYEAALSEDEVKFTQAYLANQKAFIDLETAITLKPFTHFVKVEATKKTTQTASSTGTGS